MLFKMTWKISAYKDALFGWNRPLDEGGISKVKSDLFVSI